ncbi:MAG TPA: STAS domain-containing protein [Vicinamibacteria bacterium]|nr:STAS domain-containing protein [Vicinamibacteria bacterium]
MPLSIQVRQTTVVTLVGRLDTDTSPRAEQALAPILATSPKHVVFDLAGLDFISSAGLRVLLGARKALTGAGSECLLVNMKPQIERVLEVIRSLPGMKIFASASEADDYLARIQERVLEGE